MCLPINGIGLVDVYGVLGGNSSLFCAAMNYAKLLNFEAKGMEKAAFHENLQNVIFLSILRTISSI